MRSDHGGRRAQRGQALPLILVFLLVLCMGMLVVFNTGQVVTKKVELTNTADAAAFSVAAEQARAWNSVAYLNRGRVANEVAVAQIVSINSWLTQLNVTAQNFEDVVRVIGFIFPPVQAIAQAFNAAETVFRQFRNNALKPASALAIGALDLANTAYAGLASQMVGVGGDASALQTARTVVEANSPSAELSAKATLVLGGQLLAASNTYLDTHRVRGGAGVRSTGGERYRNVVMESRDRFSRNRKDDWLVIDANGGTDLVDYDRWSAVDVNEIDFSFGFDAIKMPVGWGGAQAVNQRQPNFFPGINNGRGWDSPFDRRRHAAYNGVNNRSIAGKVIDRNNGWPRTGGRKRDAYFTQYRNGIAHTYHDVKRDYARNAALPREDDRSGPVFTVEVQSQARDLRTSSQVGLGAGRLELKDEARGDQMRAMASAQVYFNRPHAFAPFQRVVWGRTDRQFEMGSMFSPYWQARLVETPDQTRLLLALAP